MEVYVTPHPVLQRQGMDIVSRVPISYAQAVLGGEVKVLTIDGDVAYTIKPGTNTGTTVRLRGKGVPYQRNRDVRGDHYVTFDIETPKHLSSEAKEALRNFDRLSGNSLGQETSKKKGFKEKLKEVFEDE